MPSQRRFLGAALFVDVHAILCVLEEESERVTPFHHSLVVKCMDSPQHAGFGGLRINRRVSVVEQVDARNRLCRKAYETLQGRSDALCEVQIFTAHIGCILT